VPALPGLADREADDRADHDAGDRATERGNLEIE
jgi:hypothetical protein